MYKIDNKVIFIPERNLLVSINENPGIEDELARPTTRLLLELIKKNGHIVPREELLVQVWSDYGGIPSESNLNNHLTILRKRFDFWGVDRKNLETIPRKGILLNVLIEDVAETNSIPTVTEGTIHSHNESRDSLTGGEEAGLLKHHIEKRIKKVSRSNILLALAILGLFVSIITYLSITSIRTPYNAGSPLKIDNCNVYFIPSGLIQTRIESRESSTTSLKTLLEKKQITCSTEKDIYFARRPYKDNVYIYISECKNSGESTYTACRGKQFIER